ncbi:MAG: hypothetical protein AAF492_26660, partial [Verrucomicrobiota bacterium]
MTTEQPYIITRQTCRSCGHTELRPVLSLGRQTAVGFGDSAEAEPIQGPLELVLCNKQDGGCGLLQLKHTLDQDLLYRRY